MKNKSILMVVAGSIFLTSLTGLAEDRTLHIRHATVGKAMDQAYHDAGMMVDLTKYDLLEAKRQGRKVPDALLRKIDDVDHEMRLRWITLDTLQAEIIKSLRVLPPRGDYQISIQSLEDGPASELGWFAFRSVSLVWLDGTTVDIPLKSFKNNAYHAKYSYLCEPGPMAGVYGMQSSINKTIAGFDVCSLPEGDAHLVLSGLDCDKPGITRIRITINNTEIFRGKNPYRKQGFTKHEFAVPAEVFLKKITARSVEKELLSELVKLEKGVQAFSEQAKKEATQIVKNAAPFLEGFVYKPQNIVTRDWQGKFVRGMAFGYLKDYEHVVKSLHNAKTTIMYGYCTPTQYQELDKELDKVGLPYIGVGWRRDKKPIDEIWDTRSYVDTSHRREMAEQFLKDFAEGCPSYAGIAFDEPRIQEHLIRGLPTVDYQKFITAFNDYLVSRRPYLDKAGINFPDKNKLPSKIEKPDDAPLWMEWQQFKKKLMKDFFDEFNEYCKERNLNFLPVINNQQPIAPQMASFLSVADLPLVATDLYNNGKIREGFTLHLLDTCTQGKAIMTPGSGYSCKSPDRFLRSLCNGMIHGEGILQWVYVYTSKYRDPDYYWRTGGKKDERDDRGRSLFNHWNPKFWSIQKKIFEDASKAEEYLVGSRSVARTLVIYSERTAIAGNTKGKAGAKKGRTTLNYFDDEQGLYSDLVAQSRPLDLCFIEAMTPERLEQYQVIILADARLMTPREINMIREWVKNGGTLIASAETSLYDEWGRKQKDFALADMFGVHYEATLTGASSFIWDKLCVKYDEKQDYTKVAVSPGTQVLAKWNTGDPALLLKKEGKGHVWFLTMRRVGLRHGRAKLNSALFGSGASKIDKLLERILIKTLGDPIISVENEPKGVELQIRKRGDAYVVHLLDWFDKRYLDALSLKTTLPGIWKVIDPFTGKEIGELDENNILKLPPVRMYQVFILQRVSVF